MQKREFLDILRESLQDEVPAFEIESNIKYYREYIEQHCESLQDEEKCIQEIQDPRLIAQTIITSYEMSHSANTAGATHQKGYEEYREPDQEDKIDEQDLKSQVLKMIPLKYKIIGVLSTAVLLVILFFLAKLFLTVLIRVLFPLAAILLLVSICTKLFQK